jgi:spermidine synthase
VLIDPESPQVVARGSGPHGELVLRRVGAHHEIISNGVFLMDTRNGESERLLIDAACESLRAPADVLIGGLGVGFSLVEALRSAKVRSATVVEALATVIEWHRGPLREASRGAVDDPRATVVNADLVEWLRVTDRRFDAVCVDIDNGPDWTVIPDNAALYGDAGLGSLARVLRTGGVLTVWSAAASKPFARRMETHFDGVTAREVEVPRGQPDVIFRGVKR